MIIFLGVVLLVFAAVLFAWNKRYKQAQQENFEITAYNERMRAESGWSQRSEKPLNKFPAPIVSFKPLYVALIAVAIIFIDGLFFWANPGTAYAVQYPWGGDKLVATQGVSFKGYGRTIPISYEMSLQDVIIKRHSGESEEDFVERRRAVLTSDDGIYNKLAQEWEFSDAIKADIATAVIVGIHIDNEEVFLDMADRNKSESKLIYGRVIPNVNAALKNTAKLMDAQEYISGKASDFDRYFRDQLENGMYLVEEYIYEEVIPEIIGDTTTVRKVMANTGNVNKQTKWRIKRDAQGNIMRDNKSNSLSQYGITIYQAQVTGIDWENSFDERLQLQKEQVAQTQLEKQEAEKEYYRAKKEVAKGESEKAVERAKLEKEQIKLTIAAETQAKVASQNVIAEKQILEVEQLRAQSTRVAADAEAYKNQRLVQSGLTPQERVKAEIQINREKWENIAKLKLPTTYIGSGTENSGGSILEALIGAEMAKGMLKN